MIPTRQLLLFFLTALLLHCAGNWALPLIDRDEPRFAEASREMRARGDWIIPYFNNKERFDKPPLIYWMQVASYGLLGENEFAARLPSAICSALLGVVTILWGCRIYGRATGWRAGVMLMLCLQMAVHSRSSVADMPMILCVTIAAWAGREWYGAAPEARMRPWLIFWLSLGFGFLAKGPIALVPIGMLLLAGKRENQPRGSALAWAGGIVLFLVVIGSWGIPALLKTDGRFAEIGLGKHVVARSVVAMEGHGARSLLSYLGTTPFYFVGIFLSFFPWSIWLPSAFRFYWKPGSRGATERYLLWGIGLVFAIFTLSRTKLPHYTLPAFPFIALLVAHWWGRAHSRKTLQRVSVASVVVILLLTLVVFPVAAPSFPSHALFKKVETWLTPEMAIASIDYNEPSLVWLFRKKIKGFHTEFDSREGKKPDAYRKAAEWFWQPGPRVLVLPLGKVDQLFPKRDPSWRMERTEGWHLVKGRRVELAAIVKSQ